MSEQVPLVDYLVLGDSPHLRAHECTSCGARYFDRRNACASCFATEFRDVDVVPEGEVRAFTIVAHAAPGHPDAVRRRGRRLRRHERAGQPHEHRTGSRSTSSSG